MELFQASLPFVLPVAYALGMISVFMGLCSYSVLAERKVSSMIQGRVGPNRTRVPIIGHLPFVGNFLTGLGIFQPAADGLKFLFKEEITPGHVKVGYYHLAPTVALAPCAHDHGCATLGRLRGCGWGDTAARPREHRSWNALHSRDLLARCFTVSSSRVGLRIRNIPSLARFAHRLK